MATTERPAITPVQLNRIHCNIGERAGYSAAAKAMASPAIGRKTESVLYPGLYTNWYAESPSPSTIARLPMKCMHQIPTKPKVVAHINVSSLEWIVSLCSLACESMAYQLLKLYTPVPRRLSSSMVSKQPMKLARYEPRTMAGLKWLGTLSPMTYFMLIVQAGGLKVDPRRSSTVANYTV